MPVTAGTTILATTSEKDPNENIMSSSSSNCRKNGYSRQYLDLNIF
jgi:hypothetical protein